MEDAPPVDVELTASPLPYASTLARWGVTVERSPAHVRVTVPPLPGWRHLSKGFFIAGSILLAWNAIVIVAFITSPIARWYEVLPNLGLYGLPLVIIILVAHHRLTRRLVFNIDAKELIVSDIAGRRVRKLHWPRAAIAEVKLNHFNSKLLIRITGQDLIELYAASDPHITEAVADIIDSALHTPFTPEAQSTPRPVPAPLSRRARATLKITSMTLVVVAIILCFVGFPWSVLSFYFVLFAAIPAGIALGTQPREYYFS